MKINCILPSYNRSCQLHLLLESLQLNAPALDLDIRVLYKASDPEFLEGYKLCQERFPHVYWHYEEDFNYQIRNFLMCGRHVMFFTDDCVVYRPFRETALDLTSFLSTNWCVSLRMGLNTQVQTYWTGEMQQSLETHGYEEMGDWVRYNWKIRPAMQNYGYFFSWDGCLYTSSDLIELLNGRTFTNPRSFETMFANNIKGRMECPKKHMIVPRESCVFSNAINRVQEGEVPSGLTHFYSPEELNFRYLNNEVVDFSLLDVNNIQSSHTEIKLSFKQYEENT